MVSMASQITRLAIVYSAVYSGADQRKYQISASLWPVMRKMFPFDDVSWMDQTPIPRYDYHRGCQQTKKPYFDCHPHLSTSIGSGCKDDRAACLCVSVTSIWLLSRTDFVLHPVLQSMAHRQRSIYLMWLARKISNHNFYAHCWFLRMSV